MNLSEQIKDRFTKSEEKFREAVKLAEQNKVREQEYLNKLAEVIPSFEKTCKQKKFEISSFSFVKTGMDSNWEDGDYLKVSTSLKPYGSFRFIKFKGYTSSGAGKNRQQLSEKAEKLQNQFKEALGVSSVSVNPYSLEENQRVNSQDRIFLEFWIK